MKSSGRGSRRNTAIRFLTWKDMAERRNEVMDMVAQVVSWAKAGEGIKKASRKRDVLRGSSLTFQIWRKTIAKSPKHERIRGEPPPSRRVHLPCHAGRIALHAFRCCPSSIRAAPRTCVLRAVSRVPACLKDGIYQKSKCNDFSGERACPTVVDAVRFLRAKVENCHGVGRCVSFEFFCD